MLQLTESMVRATWATSLFGADRAVGLLRWGGSRRPDREAARALDVVSGTVFDQLGELTQIAYQTGDELGTEWLGLVSEGLSPRSWTAANVRQTASDIAGWSAEAGRYMTPNANGAAAWQELRNKVEIYLLVKAVQSQLRLPDAGQAFSLSEYVDRALDLGPFPAAWAIEGLGHDYAERLLEQTYRPQGMLTASELDRLPERSWPMLHAGIGLAFAQTLLADLTERSPEREVRRVLERFVALCRENSRPGLEGAALESLGLVTRTWRPRLVRSVDRLLMAMDAELAAYFWRGAGRAIYFLPINAIPGYGSTWHAVWMSRREAPHRLGRENALAGITYALTVVNMRQPGIMESLLRNHGRELEGDPAFANGVMASAILGRATTPDTPIIAEFYEHRVSGRSPGLADRWQRMIRSPMKKALNDYYPVLARHRRLGEVFRMQPLDKLVGRLTGEGA